jgi:SnoaL-like domain
LLDEAMSRENVEIWRANLEAQLAALAAGSSPEDTVTAMAEIWDPEIELDASEAAVLDVNRMHRGADEVRQFWQEWFSAWDSVQYDYELLDAGERVVMLLDLRMRGRATGIEMPFGEFAWVSTFKNGLAIHVKLYMSQAEALEAVGLGE